MLPLHDETFFLILLLLQELIRVSLSHLSCQIFEDVADMPILLGRGFVEGQFPASDQFLYRIARHFALIVLSFTVRRHRARGKAKLN